MTLNGLFENASIIPEAVVHALVLYHSSSGSVRATILVSSATKTEHFDPGGICACPATHTGRRASSSLIITSCALFLSLDSSDMSLRARSGTGLEL